MMKASNKKKAIKIIIIIAVLLGLSFIIYYFFFKPIPAWEELTDEEKIIEFQKVLNGEASVYIRPGTNEFDALLQQMKEIYSANGISFDEILFTQYYNSVNGVDSNLSKPGGTVVSAYSKPGATQINDFFTKLGATKIL